MTKEQADNQIKRIEKFSFTNREELEIIEDLKIDNYIDLIKSRFVELKSIFL